MVFSISPPRMLLYLTTLLTVLPSVLGTAEVGFNQTSYTVAEESGVMVSVCVGVITGSITDPTPFEVRVMVDGGTATLGKC